MATTPTAAPSRLTDPGAERLYPAILAGLGLALFLPGLGSFGLWDPQEVKLADAARALVQNGFAVGPQLGRPPLPIWLVATGFKLLGVGEWGGRLPIALTAVLALLAVYYAGAGLIRRRAAFLGAALLATCPEFLLGARQLATPVPMILATALATGGLARAVWPASDTSALRRLIDALLGTLGLLLGLFGSGLLVGVVAPLTAVALAAFVSGGSYWSWRILAGQALVMLVWFVRAWTKAKGYSPFVGGVPHALTNQTVVTTHLKHLGFGLFPWIAVAPLGVIDALGEPRATNNLPSEAAGSEQASDASASRVRFGQLLLVTWLVALYVAGTFQAALVSDLLLPAAPAILLLVGFFLDGALESVQLEPFAGLAVALAAIVLGRDFSQNPEMFIGAHQLEAVRWPGPLTQIPYALTAFAMLWGGLIGLGLGAPLASEKSERYAAQQRRGRLVLLGASIGTALLMALVTAQYIVPEVSKHLSAKDLYGKTKKLDPNAPIGQYRFNASGASYYSGGKTPTTLNTMSELFAFLARGERVFVMAGSDELASIDQAARTDKASYFVIDDSNSRYLVLSNRLGPTEKDLNPLRLYVSDQPPHPQHEVKADFEGKVELLGYDLPSELDRGRDFKLRLYFKVNAPVGGSYKVFAHFDGPGTRFNGDHVPLEGRFPTQHWVPGYYITDEHTLSPDRATQPSGFYHVYMGFFLGDTRLKVTTGQHDGENRVKLGVVQIK